MTLESSLLKAGMRWVGSTRRAQATRTCQLPGRIGGLVELAYLEAGGLEAGD